MRGRPSSGDQQHVCTSGSESELESCGARHVLPWAAPAGRLPCKDRLRSNLERFATGCHCVSNGEAGRA
eukprot:4746203-Prymnesium_polylepis.2